MIAGSVGANITPVINGQFIVDSPMILMYLTLTTVSLCTITFLVTIFVGKKIPTEIEDVKIVAAEEFELMTNNK